MNKMTIMHRVGAMLMLFLFPGISWAQEQKVQSVTLDLKTAIGIALNVEIEKKDYSKKEVIAGLFPRIDASASYSRTIEKQTMYMDSKAFNVGAMFDPVFNAMSQLHPEFKAPDLGGGTSSSDGMKVVADYRPPIVEKRSIVECRCRTSGRSSSFLSVEFG